MNVAELIKKLEVLDPKAEVIIRSDNFELHGAQVELSYVHLSKEGSKEVRGFRDAFDGGAYTATVYSSIGGKLPVVTLG